MNRYIHSATKALFDSDLVASRLVIALAEWFWFALLLWPGDTMARPTYLVMSHVMPEEALAAQTVALVRAAPVALAEMAAAAAAGAAVALRVQEGLQVQFAQQGQSCGIWLPA